MAAEGDESIDVGFRVPHAIAVTKNKAENYDTVGYLHIDTVGNKDTAQDTRYIIRLSGW